jgi:hypothetical protein
VVEGLAGKPGAGEVATAVPSADFLFHGQLDREAVRFPKLLELQPTIVTMVAAIRLKRVNRIRMAGAPSMIASAEGCRDAASVLKQGARGPLP